MHATCPAACALLHVSAACRSRSPLPAGRAHPPPACRTHPTSISLKAGCELFLRYTTRTSELELSDIERVKTRLIKVSCVRQNTQELYISKVGGRYTTRTSELELSDIERVKTRLIKVGCRTRSAPTVCLRSCGMRTAVRTRGSASSLLMRRARRAPPSSHAARPGACLRSCSVPAACLRSCSVHCPPHTQRGQQFAETSQRARQTIAELGARFIRTNAVVLTHGCASV